MFFSVLHSSGAAVSVEMPSPRGPRKAGQSSPRARLGKAESRPSIRPAVTTRVGAQRVGAQPVGADATTCGQSVGEELGRGMVALLGGGRCVGREWRSWPIDDWWGWVWPMRNLANGRVRGDSRAGSGCGLKRVGSKFTDLAHCAAERPEETSGRSECSPVQASRDPPALGGETSSGSWRCQRRWRRQPWRRGHPC